MKFRCLWNKNQSNTYVYEISRDKNIQTNAEEIATISQIHEYLEND